MNYKHVLEALAACPEAVAWYNDRNGATAWRDCPRGDWMLWIAEKLGVDRLLIDEAGCDCAELALVYVPEGEDRPRLAIETKRRHLAGAATDEELAAAGAAAGAAAEAARAAEEAAGAAAEAAARAAEEAAWATEAAAHAVGYVVEGQAARAAAGAAGAAEAAAGAAAWAAARDKMHVRCADAVRNRLPWSVVNAAIKRWEMQNT